MVIDDHTLEPLVEKAKDVFEKAENRAKGSFTKLRALLETEGSSSSKLNSAGQMVELTDDIFTAVC